MNEDSSERLATLLARAKRSEGLWVVLTGAGISAESGIPTFRGKEGYWTVGSREYQPLALATRSSFERMPEEVWVWYLYRRGVCLKAEPNAGHHAVVSLEQRLGERFRLITQNVDGLHLRAGSSPQRTYQIHGNIAFMRCARECYPGLVEVPAEIPAKQRGDTLTRRERDLLGCPHCEGWMRPHVLWFDESYDETRFRFNSSIGAASRAVLLLVVGTSGATNLPLQVGKIASGREAIVIDINPQPNPFSEFAESVPNGLAIRSPAAQALPGLVQTFDQLS